LIQVFQSEQLETDGTDAYILVYHRKEEPDEVMKSSNTDTPSISCVEVMSSADDFTTPVKCPSNFSTDIKTPMPLNIPEKCHPIPVDSSQDSPVIKDQSQKCLRHFTLEHEISCTESLDVKNPSGPRVSTERELSSLKTPTGSGVTVEAESPDIKTPTGPKVTAKKVSGAPKDKKSQFHNRTSFKGVPFNRQFITAVYMLYQYFLLEKYTGGPLKSVQKARYEGCLLVNAFFFFIQKISTPKSIFIYFMFIYFCYCNLFLRFAQGTCCGCLAYWPSLCDPMRAESAWP
jgi:hypothetical protein